MSGLHRSSVIFLAVTIPLEGLIQSIRLMNQMKTAPIDLYVNTAVSPPEKGSKAWELEMDLRRYLGEAEDTVDDKSQIEPGEA